MTLILLMRHGESEANKKHILSDELNKYNLTNKGIIQAKKAGSELKKIKIQKIFCSPVLRTIQTADLVNKKLKLEKTIDKKLIERRFKSMSGIYVKDASWKLLFENKIESYKNVKNRISNFMFSKSNYDCILGVTHHDVITAAMSYASNLDSLCSYAFRPTYASISGFLVDKKTIKPIFFGVPFLSKNILNKIPEQYLV
ncbi:MAG: histidine phosphatase family protein [Candidatus Micrarchaeia archaeon]